MRGSPKQPLTNQADLFAGKQTTSLAVGTEQALAALCAAVIGHRTGLSPAERALVDPLAASAFEPRAIKAVRAATR